MPNGFDSGGGFDFGGLFDGLLGALVAIIQAIIDFLNALVQALVQVLNFLFAGEQAIFGFSFKGLTDTLKGITHILDKIFKEYVLAALKHLWDLYQKLRRWLQKLKAWLDKFHALQRKYQLLALKRVINLIQRVRKVLVIFRLLHLKFATKLDHWLASIEGKIVTVMFAHARKTNEIIGWLNLILDPVRGLSHLPFFLAAGKSADSLLVIFTGRGLDFWYTQNTAAGLVLPAPITYKQHYNELQNNLATGGGDVGAWRANFSVWQDLMKQVK